jgi:hypothetical protein
VDPAPASVTGGGDDQFGPPRGSHGASGRHEQGTSSAHFELHGRAIAFELPDDPAPEDRLVKRVPHEGPDSVPPRDTVGQHQFVEPNLLGPRVKVFKRLVEEVMPSEDRRDRRPDGHKIVATAGARRPRRVDHDIGRAVPRRPRFINGRNEDQAPGHHATTAGGGADSSGATAARISCARWSKVWRASTAARARAARAARASGSAR